MSRIDPWDEVTVDLDDPKTLISECRCGAPIVSREKWRPTLCESCLNGAAPETFARGAMVTIAIIASFVVSGLAFAFWMSL